MTPYDFLVAPFADYVFMKRALAAALMIVLASAPMGVFMSLRRMTLVGDALAHALLPGVAAAVLIAGLSLWAMTLGGLVAALVVAGMAVFLTRTTQIEEDAAFSILYLFALAIGVTLVSMKGSGMNLLHLLFGDILAIDEASLALVAGVTCATLVGLAVLYRRLVVEGFDADYLAVVAAGHPLTGLTHPAFFMLLMLNLVASFQTMGTLMALGLMILPALAARFWASNIDGIVPLSVILAALCSYVGLLLSYHAGVPAGPAIVLVASSLALLSALIGRVGSFRAYLAG